MSEMKMKKVFFTIMVVFLAAVVIYSFPVKTGAVATGACSSCHTMHDSQGGVQQGTTGQQSNLTLYSCLGCHTSGGAAFAPKIDGTANTSGVGLGVLSTAGGDYNAGTQGQRHDLVSGDAFGMTPPGYSGTLTWTSQKVTCEGTYGCHGTHTTVSPGISGFHHGGSSAYRWLYAQAGNTGLAGTAVNGKESTTWEAGGATTINHNVYDGDGADSISAFCGNCHGNFHDSANTGSTSPFTRHPTDEEAVIANVDGAGFTATTATINQTPFGFTTAQIALGMVTTDIVTGTAYTSANGKAICLSCHRAHGTAQADILRFDYSTMSAGNAVDNTGCETCHVAQR